MQATYGQCARIRYRPTGTSALDSKAAVMKPQASFFKRLFLFLTDMLCFGDATEDPLLNHFCAEVRRLFMKHKEPPQRDSRIKNRLYQSFFLRVRIDHLAAEPVPTIYVDVQKGNINQRN